MLAIAAGIVEGRGLGENARAALITRGISEIARLARAKGGMEETLMGLSGIGDILLSCTSARSRNFALGVRLGSSSSKDVALLLNQRTGGLTEGVATSESVGQLARKLGVTMPIAFGVADILSGVSDIDTTVAKLLERPLGSES